MREVLTTEATEAVKFADVHKHLEHQGEGAFSLAGVTATAHAGQIVTIVGPSGSGKSTLLSLCNLMLTPDEGHVYVFGREVRAWDVQQLRREVGVVFQSPVVLSGTVLDNLSLGPRLRGESVAEPDRWLELVGLDADLQTRNAGDLSGGQKQRLCLLRTLVNQPKVLLLDETTSALDPASTLQVEHAVLTARDQFHATVLWVTHNLEEARRVGDVTWLMVNGELVEIADTEQFFTDPATDEARNFIMTADSPHGGNRT